jgi:hypothetical protein
MHIILYSIVILFLLDCILYLFFPIRWLIYHLFLQLSSYFLIRLHITIHIRVINIYPFLLLIIIWLCLSSILFWFSHLLKKSLFQVLLIRCLRYLLESVYVHTVLVILFCLHKIESVLILVLLSFVCLLLDSHLINTLYTWLFLGKVRVEGHRRVILDRQLERSQLLVRWKHFLLRHFLWCWILILFTILIPCMY